MIPPVTLPVVHAKELGAVALRAIFGLRPLQSVCAFDVDMEGMGLTVIVTGVDAPTQEPVVVVGITLYITLPAVALLRFVST